MSPQESPASPPARVRLHFLDGLRGLACLYVLLFHELNSKLFDPGELTPALRGLRAWLNYGRLSVVFFIVLSGFSLMLPIARSGKIEMAGGLGKFVYRRARRILPPYYVALALSAGLIVVFNSLGPHFGMGQRIDDAALQPASVISHLFLVHNLSFDWVYRINGPMWSVATEWQIYFVFALCLVPICRRFGALVTTGVAWLVGCAPFFLLPKDANFYWACPWFIGSFSLGMYGALIGFAPSYQGSVLRSRVPWGWLGLAGFVLLIALARTGRADSWPYPVLDFVVSLFAFAWINACVARSQLHLEARSLMLRILGSRALVYLGGFSYSLYLIQHPMLRFLEKGVARLHWGPDASALAQLFLATPIVMAAAWLFSELFERPFTSGGIVLPALRRLISAPRAETSS